MELEEYLRTEYPHALAAYKRRTTYQWSQLEVGTILWMLKAGFGGDAGVFRTVTKIKSDNFGNFAELSNLDIGMSDRHYLLYEEIEDYGRKRHFSEACHILTHEEYSEIKGMTYREMRKRYFELTGKDLY